MRNSGMNGHSIENAAEVVEIAKVVLSSSSKKKIMNSFRLFCGWLILSILASQGQGAHILREDSLHDHGNPNLLSSSSDTSNKCVSSKFFDTS